MKKRLYAALAVVAASPVFAANTLIDFETSPSFESIGEYYNSGAGGALGVSFTGGALGLVNDELGPYFSNAPSPVGVMTPVDADATMNVRSGFVNSISFYYSSSSVLPSSVMVWSGIDGTGGMLASFNLAENSQAGGCIGSAYCRFDLLSSPFEGTAHSVTFGNAANTAAFDNLSITTVPEPSTALLMMLGLAGLLAARRRG
jgi:hypothetical protein